MFYLEKPIIAARDATVEGTVTMVRQANNPRLYNVKVGELIHKSWIVAVISGYDTRRCVCPGVRVEGKHRVIPNKAFYDLQ